MTTDNILSLHYAAFTHSGKLYQQNQDALLLAGTVQQKAGFWQGQIGLNERLRFAVADGAGGLPSAAKASRILLQTLLELDKTQPLLSPRPRLVPLHHRLVNASKSQHSLQNAGSTLVTAEIAVNGQITLWHVGDSRGYHHRTQGLRRLTDDHTLAYCLSRSGHYSKAHLQTVATTQLGQALDNLFIFSQDAEEPFIGLQWLTLVPGETLVLVSDGVTLYLTDDMLASCLGGSDLVANVRQIYEQVMAAGAEDNVSVIAMRIE